MEKWTNFYLCMIVLYALKILVFIGKTQPMRVYKDRGSKRSPNFFNKAVKTQLWPRFRGLGVAKWPHSGGTRLWFLDFLLSSARFSV